MSGPIEDHVRRRDDGSREYVDSQGHVFPSVTTVISAASSKPWLTKWSAKLAAEFAVDQWNLVTETLTAAGREAAVDLVKGAANRMRDEAADIGTFLHDVVEALVTDGPVPIVPEELEPYVDAFLQFWMDFDPTPLLAEATVSTDPAETNRQQYAGRVDLLLDILLAAADLERLGLRDVGTGSGPGRVTVLVDVKTGANIDATMSAQLAAYRRADRVWLPLGEYAPLPKTDAAFVLHLRPNGYRLLPVDTDGRSYAAFLRMLELWHWKDDKGDRIVGLPILAPKEDGSQADRPIEHVLDTSPKLCESLIAEGLPTCEAVADATAARLLKVKGVGPKTLDKIITAIGEAGLKLRDGV